jgi:hypothetical protein
VQHLGRRWGRHSGWLYHYPHSRLDVGSDGGLELVDWIRVLLLLKSPSILVVVEGSPSYKSNLLRLLRLVERTANVESPSQRGLMVIHAVLSFRSVQVYPSVVVPAHLVVVVVVSLTTTQQSSPFRVFRIPKKSQSQCH